MRAPDLAAAAGLTYRQLDWLVRQGHIHPAERDPSVGSGVPRDFTPYETRVVIHTGALMRTGMAPQIAVLLARRLVANGRARIADNLTLSTAQPPNDPPLPQPTRRRPRRRERDTSGPDWAKHEHGIWRAT